jgi:hypothetical protein
MVFIAYLPHLSARSATIIVGRPVASSTLEQRKLAPMAINRDIRNKRARSVNPKEMLLAPRV